MAETASGEQEGNSRNVVSVDPSALILAMLALLAGANG